MNLSCNSVDSDWKETEAMNTIEAYQQFIDKYSARDDKSNLEMILLKKAKEQLNDLVIEQEYAGIRTSDSIPVLEEFINKYRKYSMNRNVLDAKRRLRKLRMPIEYESALKKNSVDDYLRFLKSYPNSVQASKVKELLQPMLKRRALSLHRLSDLEIYTELYPDDNSSKARRIRTFIRYEQNFVILSDEERALPKPKKGRQDVNDYLASIKPRADFKRKLERALKNDGITKDHFDILERRNRENAKIW